MHLDRHGGSLARRAPSRADRDLHDSSAGARILELHGRPQRRPRRVGGRGFGIALASHGNLALVSVALRASSVRVPFLMRIHTYACEVEMP
jgi:hypothetical protein